MEESNRSLRGVRFGVFEVDLRSGELRKQGLKIKLQGQPIQILSLLLERPGELVTREELREKLWPADTFVDFEHGLNAAIKKLRAGLGDSADNPRFVETLHRRGYRFIAPVEGRPAPPISPSLPAPAGGKPVWRLAAAGFAVVALLAVLVGLNVGGWQERLLGGAAPGQITSLAVLPLENMMGDAEQDYFVEGMHEALITELSKIGALKVISRTSVMRYKGTDKSVPEIARELGVDALIEGSVLRAGDQVRITAQLIEAATDRQLWAESYERDLRDVLALQSEVARAIAREIRVNVTAEEEALLSRADAVNPAAHERYMLGQYHLRRGTQESAKRAIEYFEEALTLDPAYALAHSGLGGAYIFLSSTFLPPAEILPKAEEALQKALELDPLLAEAHAQLGFIALNYHWDFARAENSFLRALELNSKSAKAHLEYGNYLAIIGRAEEASSEIQVAFGLDPLSVASRGLGLHSLLVSRQYDQLIAEAGAILELEPDQPSVLIAVALAYTQQEKLEEAVKAAEHARRLTRNPLVLAGLGETYARAGMRKKAEQVLDELEKLAEERYVCPYNVGCVYLALGDEDKAFEQFNKAIDIRSD